MDCQRCYREISGCEITIAFPLTLKITSQHVESSPDRDWIECEACGLMVCFHCCRHPASGFCDACIAKYDLTAELTGIGFIPEVTYEETAVHAIFTKPHCWPWQLPGLKEAEQ